MSVRPVYDVFVSYAHVDSATAIKLVEFLESAGYRVWWDRDLLAGDDWIRELQVKLDQSRKVIVLWSNAAALSKHVYREAAYAYARGKLIAFSLEALAWPREFSNVHTPTIDNAFRDKSWISRQLGPTQGVHADTRSSSAKSRVCIAGLPLAASPLIGRRGEIEMLMRAWASGGGPDNSLKTNVVTLVGLGGEGKTALLRGFLDELRQKGWLGSRP